MDNYEKYEDFLNGGDVGEEDFPPVQSATLLRETEIRAIVADMIEYKTGGHLEAVQVLRDLRTTLEDRATRHMKNYLSDNDPINVREFIVSCTLIDVVYALDSVCSIKPRPPFPQYSPDRVDKVKREFDKTRKEMFEKAKFKTS